MDLAQILIDLLDKPDIPRPYRELQKYFANANRPEEAAAIASLLERKFEKKNETTTDGSHSN